MLTLSTYEQVDKVATGGKKCFSNRLKFLLVFIRQLRHRSDLKMKEGENGRSCTSGLQDFADAWGDTIVNGGRLYKKLPNFE